jgi:hypothetical protein
MHAHYLEQQDRAEYGEQPIGQLVAHPELAERMLYDGSALYRAYPILPTSAKLAWR